MSVEGVCGELRLTTGRERFSPIQCWHPGGLHKLRPNDTRKESSVITAQQWERPSPPGKDLHGNFFEILLEIPLSRPTRPRNSAGRSK